MTTEREKTFNYIEGTEGAKEEIGQLTSSPLYQPSILKKITRIEPGLLGGAKWHSRSQCGHGKVFTSLDLYRLAKLSDASWHSSSVLVQKK